MKQLKNIKSLFSLPEFILSFCRKRKGWGWAKISLTLLMLFTMAVNGMGQNYGNIWCFGDSIKLDFNSCSPIVSTSSNEGFEGASAISDSLGNLLFYTNSDYVWDNSNNIMPNGMLGTGPASLSQVVIIPKPNSSSVYYIFTTQLQTLPSSRKFQFHEVDMSLNNGLGDVVVKNVELWSNNTTEQVAATHHTNGIDVWITTHEYGTNNFLSFLVTSTGIIMTPTVTAIGSSHAPCPANTNARGNIKFSPNGNKLAFNGNSYQGNNTCSILELFDFDNSTGSLSNHIRLPYQGGEFGLSFSPDNNKLYCSTWQTGSITQADSNYIYQFDLSSGDSSIIVNSKYILFSGMAAFNFIGDLKIAPNGKIYVAKQTQKYLGVINNPNLIGVSCNYVDSGLYLNGRFCQFGLNNYIEYTTYCNSTFIEEYSNSLIKIYPNPTTNQFTIEKATKPYTFTIYNSIGQLLFNETNVTETSRIVDISNYPKGILFVHINSNRETYTQKIIKN